MVKDEPETCETSSLKRSLKRERRSPPSSSSSSSDSSRSPSPKKSRHRSRHSRSKRRSSRSRSRSHFRRKRYYGSRENPYESRVIGIFGLNSTTDELKLMDVFSKFGSIERVNIVHDAKTGNSRGFAFIYFLKIDDASNARRKFNGATLDGRRIRVDYSITKRPHTPTPGEQRRLWIPLFLIVTFIFDSSGVYMGNANERDRQLRSSHRHRRSHRGYSSSSSRSR